MAGSAALNRLPTTGCSFYFARYTVHTTVSDAIASAWLRPRLMSCLSPAAAYQLFVASSPSLAVPHGPMPWCRGAVSARNELQLLFDCIGELFWQSFPEIFGRLHRRSYLQKDLKKHTKSAVYSLFICPKTSAIHTIILLGLKQT
jgi:hypothetical protein